MTRSAFDAGGRALEFGDHSYRSDSYSIEVMVVER
jgi:GntR family transcriptional regulator